MADIGIWGAGAGTLITQRPLGEVERRLSAAVSENERRASTASVGRRRSSAASGGRRPSVVQQALHIVDPEKLDFTRRKSLITPHDLETIREAKQAQGETFAAGGDTRFYEPIDSYEGKHRWDPNAEWTPEEEKRVVGKLDWKICSWACLMFFALQLDRGNISQALTDNFLNLGLDTNQYNYGQTIFYISFLCAELPSYALYIFLHGPFLVDIARSQMISKKIGPDNWIPIQMIWWSIVAICQCKLNGQASFYVTRSLLGLIEGGFIPDVILYLSYFYKSKELPIRLSFFWSAYIFTQVVSAFFAFGILRLRRVNGWEGWRWMFALEGCLTTLIGIASWFYLPPSPTQTASRFRGKDGWFTEREEIIMVNRILRDDPSKGDMHNRQGLSIKFLWQALTDWDLFPIYLLGLTWTLPHATIQAYLTLTLRSIGFGTFQTNLLTIPGSVLLLLQLIFWTWVSEKINNRFGVVLLCQLWMLPLLIALAVLPSDYSAWSRYAILLLLSAYPYVHAIIVAITSRNAGTVRTRTVGSALYNMSVQASSIIASNVYQKDDMPFYRRGNQVLVAITS